MSGTPIAVCLAVLILLIGVAVVGGGDGDSEGGAAPAAPRSAPVGAIAKRVEGLRRLRFEELPRPERVTAAQAQREGLQDLDRDYPPQRRHADEELYKLLGLLEPDVDLRDVTASVFGEGVAGYYDPRSGRLRVVAGAATGTRVLNEVVLAHELTHALEDQRFGLDLEDLSTSGDAGLAHLALVEGTATALMFEYAERFFTPEEALAGFLGSAFQDTGDLPPFVTAQLVFPYLRGKAFVERLFHTGNRTWRLVDVAYRFRPPASTEQILHPDRYLRVDQPRPVAIDVARVLGSGWRRVTAGVFGEWQTGELLRLAGGSPTDAAAGWGGDRYELWRDGTCPAPCTAHDALALRWVWDSDRDRREFATAVREYVSGGLDARPAGRDVWSSRGGAVAVAERAGAVTLAFAPSPQLARRLAAAPAAGAASG
jgi:hypothetical protein